MGIKEKYYSNQAMTAQLKNVLDIFDSKFNEIDSSKVRLKSNEVLSVVEKKLIDIGFKVEKSKKKIDKIPFEIQLDDNETLNFDVDAYDSTHKIIIEVEAGRAFANNQFLKDLVETMIIEECDYLIIAVRVIYRTKNSKSKDFEKVRKYLTAFYNSKRIEFHLKGMLLIGY